MIAEFGVFFLVMSFLIAVVQSLYLFPIRSVQNILGRISPIASWLQALSICLALATLMILRLDSDFSVVNVINNSNLSLPTLYKIAGTWGNHEGSMLLWVLVLAFFGALLAGRCHTCEGRYLKDSHLRGNDNIVNYATAMQSSLSAGFLAFILWTSNPFARQFPPPTDGQALNPLLQDMGLAIHPPLLYLGYVGFSIVFSLAVSALICGKADRVWAEIAHKWILVSWSSLTLGIGLGSWWAYRELGWGGWWFWDPVENASLLPWIAGTALLHSNIVLKKRGLLASWVVLLSIITFALSLLGTFLVRSGAITSVHSFASDPARGTFILAYIFVTVGGALLLYSIRGATITNDKKMLPASREGLIIINNLFLLSACATVLIGTLYPIFIEISGGEKITVGSPYFQATFVPLMALPLIFAAITPFMAWKKASITVSLRAMRPALFATIAAIFVVIAIAKTQVISAICGFGLAVWLMVGSIQWLIKSKGKSGKYSVFLGHIGAGIMVLGITASGLWKEEKQGLLAPNDFLTIAGYNVYYKGISDITGENYSAKRAELVVQIMPTVLASTKSTSHDYGIKTITTLFPEYRTYAIRGSNTSEADILSSVYGDLYSVIGETNSDGKTAIRLYFQPLINFVWLGFIVMAFAGIFSLINFGKKSQTIKKLHSKQFKMRLDKLNEV